ncbi:MAG TPA: hypothetical protein PLD88_09010, partial [Candidatus Berkiella sp.]|nr:hypothetical protein [Candidatus Berkiella sp.]
MTLNDFSYFFLMFDRVSLAAYVLFVLMLLSFYWVKHHFLRGAIFFVFFILALYAGRLEWIALPIVIVMGATFYYGFNGQRKIRRG